MGRGVCAPHWHSYARHALLRPGHYRRRTFTSWDLHPHGRLQRRCHCRRQNRWPACSFKSMLAGPDPFECSLAQTHSLHINTLHAQTPGALMSHSPTPLYIHAPLPIQRAQTLHRTFAAGSAAGLGASRAKFGNRGSGRIERLGMLCPGGFEGHPLHLQRSVPQQNFRQLNKSEY